MNHSSYLGGMGSILCPTAWMTTAAMASLDAPPLPEPLVKSKQPKALQRDTFSKPRRVTKPIGSQRPSVLMDAALTLLRHQAIDDRKTIWTAFRQWTHDIPVAVSALRAHGMTFTHINCGYPSPSKIAVKKLSRDDIFLSYLRSAMMEISEEHQYVLTGDPEAGAVYVKSGHPLSVAWDLIKIHHLQMDIKTLSYLELKEYAIKLWSEPFLNDIIYRYRSGTPLTASDQPVFGNELFAEVIRGVLNP